jgi:hypothetical protein
MLNRSITNTLAALAIAGASVTAAYASEEALLDALVKKGVLKQADAQKIKAESAHHGSGGNSKIKLNESVKEMAIYGDLQLRWQHAQAQQQVPTGTPVNRPDLQGGGNLQDQSSRFRLLLGTRFSLTDGVFGGVELATSNFNNSADRFNTYGGNQQNSDYNLGISKAYVGWNATSEIKLVAGRQSVPFYSTEMVWDNDVRLDGITEDVNLGKLLGLGDGLGLHFIAGQFIMGNQQSYIADINPNGNNLNTDGWMYQAQFKITADLGAKLTFAPGFLWANGANDSGGGIGKGTLGLQFPQNNGVAGFPPGAGGQWQDAYLSDLAVLLLPGDVTFDLAGTKAKFLWDFAYNFGASVTNGDNTQRLTPNLNFPGDTSSTQDSMAWLVGVQLGQNKHKGDFSAFANYRQVGAAAVNAAFSDSDFGLGFLNQRGFQVGVAYSPTNSTKVSLTYSASSNLDQDSIYPQFNAAQGTLNGFGNLDNTGVNTTHLVALQLGVKF